MNKILLIVVILGLPGSLIAQDQAPEVTVFLKNGQKVTGRMQLSIHENYLTLEHDSLSRTQLAYHAIKKIYFGDVPEEEPPPYFEHERGFFHLAELGLQVGDNDSEANATLSIHTVNGYAFSPYLMTGLGVGLDQFGSVSTVPLYASVRGSIVNRKASPIYYGSIGRSWAWPTDDVSGIDYEKTRGGLYLHAGLGYQINLKQSAFTFTGGYKIQKIDFVYNFQDWQGESRIEEKRTIRRLVISFGYTF
ncbi:MAG: hypothetical protein AAF632_27985 [Bacteroidota bacterium]